MRPSQPVQSGMPTGHKYMGWWGSFGGPPQRGIVQYGLSHYRVNPMQGAFKSLVEGFITRVPGKALYIIPPLAACLGTIKWAQSDNHFRNSKAGHLAGKTV